MAFQGWHSNGQHEAASYPLAELLRLEGVQHKLGILEHSIGNELFHSQLDSPMGMTANNAPFLWYSELRRRWHLGEPTAEAEQELWSPSTERPQVLKAGLYRWVLKLGHTEHSHPECSDAVRWLEGGSSTSSVEGTLRLLARAEYCSDVSAERQLQAHFNLPVGLLSLMYPY